MSNIIFKLGKREEYINAWNEMYKLDKDKWNNKIFDGVNPSLSKKPLTTEIDNFSVIAYDNNKPIGIFLFVVTKSKVIGKQFVVDPEYQGKGIGTALIMLNEKQLRDNGYEWYYIGCSSMSKRIYENKFGLTPDISNEEQDLYKFNRVNVQRSNFEEDFDKYIIKKDFKIK